jgi:hypothetical protein
MITLVYVGMWWLIGFLIIQIYQKFGILVVDTNVDSYRLRVKILLSFSGFINLILIPILRVR